MTRTETTAQAVTNYRAAATALRGIAYRAAKYGGGNGATTKAIAYHEVTMDIAIRNLMAAGERELVGHLTEERKMAERLAGIKAQGGPARPELARRLAATRKILRAAE